MAETTTVLTEHERTCVRHLVSHGWDAKIATVGVVMAIRRPTRPRASLVDWLTQFPGLESKRQAESALVNAEANGWFTQQHSPHGLRYLVPIENIGTQIAEAIEDPDFADSLAYVPVATQDMVRVVGRLVSFEAYDSYLERLGQARVSIDLPVMRPSPEEGAATIIKARAREGVLVRMLIASDAVITDLWGSVAARSTQHVRESWIEISESLEHFEIRICENSEDMRLATCAGIDRSLVRWDVYDHREQRTLDGTMLEIESPPGLRLNLVDLFYEEFERAWSRGRPVGQIKALWWRVISAWQWSATALFLAVALFTVNWVPISSISASVAATFFVNAMVASGNKYRLRRRQRGEISRRS